MLEILLLVAFFIFLWRGVDWVCREWENVLERDLPMISCVKANAKRVSSKTPKTWKEMSPAEKRKAVAEKKRTGMGKRTSSLKRKTKKK